MEYSQLISIGNLFQAWDEFKKGKRKKFDVQTFERNLEDNLFTLHEKLKNKTYKHGHYSEFYVNDPKRRHIHKASVEDRIVHHLLYKYLYSLFDKIFIYDSYSCRLEKGTHKAVKGLEKFARKLSKNYSCDFWALKLDIRQFFASVDHKILLKLIEKRFHDKNILWLIEEVINSFNSCSHSELDSESKPKTSKRNSFAFAQNDKCGNRGIPLGNLTSQIFANIYLNELDQFIKHKLKVKYYLRYADDFLFLFGIKEELATLLHNTVAFLDKELLLKLHPQKILLRRFSWGIDFCGYIVLPHYILPRTKTKRRIEKKVAKQAVSSQSLASYLGYLSHANSHKLSQTLSNFVYLDNL